MTDNNYITTMAAVCRQLGICKSTLYNWHRAGLIQYDVIGRRIILPPETLQKYGIKREG